MKMESKQITVKVCSLEEYRGERWPFDNSLEGAIAWLQDKLAEIPEPYRDVATCEVTSEWFHESSHATLEISYRRPETDDERNSRLAKEETDKAKHRERAIAEAKATLARYGQPEITSPC